MGVGVIAFCPRFVPITELFRVVVTALLPLVGFPAVIESVGRAGEETPDFQSAVVAASTAGRAASRQTSVASNSKLPKHRQLLSLSTAPAYWRPGSRALL